MRITTSARRHGITDGDMLHAVDHPVRVLRNQGDYDLTMIIGATTSGALIEVGIVTDDTEDRIVHAMPARPKYLP